MKPELSYVRKIAEESLDVIFFAVGLIILILVNPVYEKGFYGIPTFFFGVAFIILGSIIRVIVVVWSIVRSFLSPNLNIIGWWGFDKEIRGNEKIRAYLKKSKFRINNYLGYTRFITKFSELQINGKSFDVLILDIEYLKQYSRSLIPISKNEIRNINVGKLWEKLIPGIDETQICNNLGIPIRCGLNALLINKNAKDEIVKKIKKANKKNDENISELADSIDNLQCYNILNPSNLDKLPDDPKIGIWDSFLTSLTIFLLADGVPLDKVFEKESSNKVLEITAKLKENSTKFISFSDPDSVRRSIENGAVWIIPGGGGWLKPLSKKGESQGKVEVIVPEKEGALLWIECACIPKHGNKDLAIRYIEHLLDEKTQIGFSKLDVSLSCPVTKDAIKKMKGPRSGDLNIDLVDCERIFKEDQNELKLKEKVKVRQLPEDWRIWQKAWDEFMERIDQK